MNLYSVAEQINARLLTIDGLLQAHIGDPASVTPPCSVIALPEEPNFLGAFRGGMTRVENWQLILLAGAVDKVESFSRIAEYCDPDDPSSIQAVLESKDAMEHDPYTACDGVIVKGVTFEIITWQGQDFQGALFMLDVFGSGSA